MPSDPRPGVLLALFEQHYELVYRFAKRSLDASAAEDIAQEVFARLLRLPDLASREIRPGYLIQIAKNLMRRRHDSERRFARHAASAEACRAAGREAEPGIDRPTEAIRRAVGGLDDRERQAVELVTLRGLSYKQAAASMGVKITDVNNWRYRGVERLRSAVQEGAYGRAE